MRTQHTDKICKIMFALNIHGLRNEMQFHSKKYHYKSGQSIKPNPLQRNEMPNENNHWWQEKKAHTHKTKAKETKARRKKTKTMQYMAQARHNSVIISIFLLKPKKNKTELKHCTTLIALSTTKALRLRIEFVIQLRVISWCWKQIIYIL